MAERAAALTGRQVASQADDLCEEIVVLYLGEPVSKTDHEWAWPGKDGFAFVLTVSGVDRGLTTSTIVPAASS